MFFSIHLTYSFEFQNFLYSLFYIYWYETSDKGVVKNMQQNRDTPKANTSTALKSIYCTYSKVMFYYEHSSVISGAK